MCYYAQALCISMSWVRYNFDIFLTRSKHL